MSKQEETIEAFVVRCYSDDFNRGNYASIICDVCDSVEDVADAIVEYLEEYVEDDDGKPLSRETWQRVRARIAEGSVTTALELKPDLLDELVETNAPESIKINRVRLSPRLIERIRKGE